MRFACISQASLYQDVWYVVLVLPLARRRNRYGYDAGLLFQLPFLFLVSPNCATSLHSSLSPPEFVHTSHLEFFFYFPLLHTFLLRNFHILHAPSHFTSLIHARTRSLHSSPFSFTFLPFHPSPFLDLPPHAPFSYLGCPTFLHLQDPYPTAPSFLVFSTHTHHYHTGNMKEEPPPTVMIVGAGLGGLTLAILLQRAGIEYQLFEKSTEIKPFGTPPLPSFHTFFRLSRYVIPRGGV